MRKVEVLGPGCANCVRLAQHTTEAAEMAGVEVEITKVTDWSEIIAYGIMGTPGIAVDGRVVSYGRVPSAADIVPWLADEDRPSAQNPSARSS